MRRIVVFDTSTLFSGVGWRGNPYRCVELARAGVVEGVTCQELLNELTEKLQVKLNFSAAQVTDTVADLPGFLQVVTITNTLKFVVADPDDDKVLECAVVGGASHIITSDRHHLLPLGSYQGISIISAAQFLTLVSIG
ncbi:MAG: putative toxin-antitoxin system toxin component, PIN family [Candidatus Tectomicrobia bacterium]|uniref:Toxin-antitoxin system toxin component, PIN family n=1 Tax=Tectimicrobiota bacterium TaxID=2528274 RepID=A0A932CQ93_UNCTE|nr:putative toxin-antitoxin system toxin component, PIN family [Candidatus Tectomicrobia bacterium]